MPRAVVPPVDVDLVDTDRLAPNLYIHPLRAGLRPIAVRAVAVIGGVDRIETVVECAREFPREKCEDVAGTATGARFTPWRQRIKLLHPIKSPGHPCPLQREQRP